MGPAQVAAEAAVWASVYAAALQAGLDELRDCARRRGDSAVDWNLVDDARALARREAHAAVIAYRKAFRYPEGGSHG